MPSSERIHYVKNFISLISIFILYISYFKLASCNDPLKHTENWSPFVIYLPVGNVVQSQPNVHSHLQNVASGNILGNPHQLLTYSNQPNTHTIIIPRYIMVQQNPQHNPHTAQASMTPQNPQNTVKTQDHQPTIVIQLLSPPYFNGLTQTSQTQNVPKTVQQPSIQQFPSNLLQNNFPQYAQQTYENSNFQPQSQNVNLPPYILQTQNGPQMIAQTEKSSMPGPPQQNNPQMLQQPQQFSMPGPSQQNNPQVLQQPQQSSMSGPSQQNIPQMLQQPQQSSMSGPSRQNNPQMLQQLPLQFMPGPPNPPQQNNPQMFQQSQPPFMSGPPNNFPQNGPPMYGGPEFRPPPPDFGPPQNAMQYPQGQQMYGGQFGPSNPQQPPYQ